MAIDGTRIIDSDLAHDVYNEFMDLYDSGIDIVAIRQKLETWRRNVVDDVELEIFITAYVQALWEVGELDQDILAEIKVIINEHAGARMWREESGEKDAAARERALSRFLLKVSTPRVKPRKRKKHSKVKNLIFQDDDVVTFQLPDKTYRAAIMTKSELIRGNTIYQFARTAFIGSSRPTEQTMRESGLFVQTIGTYQSEREIKDLQPGIQKVWELDRSRDKPYMVGLFYDFIDHRDLKKFSDRLAVVGSIVIRKGFKQSGSFGYCLTFDDLAERYVNFVDRQVRVWTSRLVPISVLEEKMQSDKTIGRISRLFG